MKALLFSLALSLTLAAGTVGTGGGSTSPKGGVLDVATTGTGGGSTSPKGGVLDVA